jgi:hypothetical protein
MIPLVPFANTAALPAVFRAHGAMIVVGMYTPDEARALRAELAAEFVRSRWSLRRVQDGKLGRSLMMRREHVSTRSLWKRLLELRNYIAGQPLLWTAAGPQDDWWTDARFNLYPRGAGWMDQHSDAAYVGAEPPGGFVQPLLQLSERGVDFSTGGGYVVLDGKRVSTDTRPGDVVVYNGAIPHGVHPVDGLVTTPDFDALNGRLVAAVTPLRVLS